MATERRPLLVHCRVVAKASLLGRPSQSVGSWPHSVVGLSIPRLPSWPMLNPSLPHLRLSNL